MRFPGCSAEVPKPDFPEIQLFRRMYCCRMLFPVILQSFLKMSCRRPFLPEWSKYPNCPMRLKVPPNYLRFRVKSDRPQKLPDRL